MSAGLVTSRIRTDPGRHGFHTTMVDLLLGMWGGSECGAQQLVDDVVYPSLRHRLGNTPAQMRLQDVATDPVQGTLHRRQLVEHVDAISVSFDHADHPIDMPP